MSSRSSRCICKRAAAAFIRWIAFLMVLAARVAPAQTPVEARVGIVAFQDFHQELERYERLFDDLTRSSKPPIRFRLASGTYGDVKHWLDRGMVDVAILSPGVFAEWLQPRGTTDDPARCRYLATAGLRSHMDSSRSNTSRSSHPPVAAGPLSRRSPDETGAGSSGYRYGYRSVCVTAADSLIRNVADLRRAVRDGRARFLFVHPLSVSGRIAPEFALRQVGVVPGREQAEYTYSHSNSLRLLAEPDPEHERVAFIWEDAWAEESKRGTGCRALPFPELDALSIPQDVVVARRDFPHGERVASLLAAHADARGVHDFKRFEDWMERYGVVRQWNDALGLPAEKPETQMVSLNEIGRILLHYARSQPQPPRLALVLSGGGAKCSYQVGAIAALEQKLSNLRRENREEGLDIALVVGTSGGAMNALPVALGVTSTLEGQNDFRAVWKELDQREMIHPSRLVRINLGLWFTALQAVLLFAMIRWFFSNPSGRGWGFAISLIALGTIEALIAFVFRVPWSWMGANHALHHLWLWTTFGIRGSAWFLLGTGCAMLLIQGLLRNRGHPLGFARRAMGWILAAGLVGLPAAQAFTMLFYEKTLSDGSGIEAALSQKYPRMINARLRRQGMPPLELKDSWNDDARLCAISRQIFSRRLLQRDLVFTASCLSQTSAELPMDLYFHAAADSKRPSPRYGARGAPLAEHPSLLLDVVMGSGSIFPIFPPRELRDFPRPGHRVELVDGGFAHNSPIEAAILWGATHLVLIEASPEERSNRRNFMANVTEAFNHLYNQAQRADAQSKGQVVIFTLAPTAPHLCVIDFADNLISAAMDKGYCEASGHASGRSGLRAEQPRFRKELGEPLFWETHARSATFP